jgi:hypothetical protein
VKIANTHIFLIALVYGLISARVPLHAQSAIAPVAADDDNAPWNQGVTNETREAARTVFLEGNRLFKIPLFARAADKYIEALSQWKHPAFYFNLALAQLNLSQELEARDNLEQALKYGTEPLGTEHFEEAKKQLEEVERQLGRIHITCQTRGAEVTMDGATLFIGPGSYEGWAKASAHEVTAKRSGYLSEARRVTVSSGKLQHVELKLITLSEAAEAGRRWAVWKPWSVLGAGAAVVATSGGLHAMSSKNFQAFDTQFLKLPCVTTPDPRAPGCAKNVIPPDLNAQLNLARKEQIVAVGGYIVGGSLIATGVVLVFLNRPRLLEQPPTSSPPRTLAVVPTVSKETFGIVMSVSL